MSNRRTQTKKNRATQHKAYQRAVTQARADYRQALKEAQTLLNFMTGALR